MKPHDIPYICIYIHIYIYIYIHVYYVYIYICVYIPYTMGRDFQHRLDKEGKGGRQILAHAVDLGLLRELCIRVKVSFEAASSVFNACTEGPSTLYSRTLVPKAMKGIVFRTRNLKYWVLGSSGLFRASRFEGCFAASSFCNGLRLVSQGSQLGRCDKAETR